MTHLDQIQSSEKERKDIVTPLGVVVFIIWAVWIGHSILWKEDAKTQGLSSGCWQYENETSDNVWCLADEFREVHPNISKSDFILGLMTWYENEGYKPYYLVESGGCKSKSCRNLTLDGAYENTSICYTKFMVENGSLDLILNEEVVVPDLENETLEYAVTISKLDQEELICKITSSHGYNRNEFFWLTNTNPALSPARILDTQEVGDLAG